MQQVIPTYKQASIFIILRFCLYFLWRVGKDLQDVLITHGSKLYRMSWNPTTSHWVRHLMWLRTDNSGSCWQCSVSHWKSAQVVNSHLVCDPTIRQPGFDLPWQQWSLLNRYRTEQGHCGACRRKRRLTDTDLCPCGETQTMSQIVESCHLTKLNSGLSRLHSADEDAVSWLISYG